MNTKLLILVLGLCLLCGCGNEYVKKSELQDYFLAYTNPELYASNTQFNRTLERFYQKTKFKQEFKEWEFINEKKLFYSQCFDAYCGYQLEDVSNNEKNIFEGYFSNYTTLDKLQKKWLGKPKPKGLDEFLATELIPNIY